MYKRQLLDEELAQEIPNCTTTKQVIGNYGFKIIGVKEGLLLVPELMEAPGEEVAEDEVTQEVVNESQTDFNQLIAYR